MFPSPPGDGCPAGQTVMRVANRRLAPFGREQPVGALADPANSAGQEGNFSCFDSVRLDSPERAVLYVLLLSKIYYVPATNTQKCELSK